MNNDETTKKNAVENNSLMRKTKAQLVEIILRKDSIERNLRADIKGTEAELNNTKSKIDTMQYDYSELKNDYNNICDEKASIECELNITIKKQKIFMWLLAIILCISIAFNYIFYII